MSQRMIGVLVAIDRFVSDEPQPGVVHCGLTDALGGHWTFLLKTAMVSHEHIDGQSDYPRPGTIACRVLGRRIDPTGLEAIEIEIDELPEEADPAESSFKILVPPNALVEWEWGSDTQRPWDGRP